MYVNRHPRQRSELSDQCLGFQAIRPQFQRASSPPVPVALRSPISYFSDLSLLEEVLCDRFFDWEFAESSLPPRRELAPCAREDAPGESLAIRIHRLPAHVAMSRTRRVACPPVCPRER